MSLRWILALVLTLAAPAAFAQDFDRAGAYAALNGVYAVELFDDVPSSLVDNGVGVSARLGYRFGPVLAVEGQVDWSGDFVDCCGADVTQTLITLNGKLYFPVGRIQPYGLVGVGVDFAKASPGSDEEDFVAKLGGGLDLYFTEQLGLLAEVTYNLPTGDLDEAEYLSIGWGLFYRF